MIKPTGYYVLILPDDVAEVDEIAKIAKEMDFQLPDETLAREQAASVRGTLVDIGPLAWKNEGLGNVNWAEVGDKVFFPRHNNHALKDPDDGKTYFLIADDKILSKYKEGSRDE